MERNFEVNENYVIRSAYDSTSEVMYYSVVDMIDYIFDYEYPTAARDYWSVMKHRLRQDPKTAYLVNCEKAKMIARDGKKRYTDVATLDQLINIVNYICFPKKSEHFRSYTGCHVRSFNESSLSGEVKRMLRESKDCIRYDVV